MDTEDVLLVSYDASALHRWPMTAQVPPHIAVIQAHRDEIAEIARHARLVIVRSTAGEVSIIGDVTALDDLDDAGRLFVNAWRDQPASKHREGEGLSWDAPGFEPPDPPRA